jgi:hypothetical protein
MHALHHIAYISKVIELLQSLCMFLQVEDAFRTFSFTVRNVFHEYMSDTRGFSPMFAKHRVFAPLLTAYLDDTRHFKYSLSPVGEPNNSFNGNCMAIQT